MPLKVCAASVFYMKGKTSERVWEPSGELISLFTGTVG